MKNGRLGKAEAAISGVAAAFSLLAAILALPWVYDTASLNGWLLFTVFGVTAGIFWGASIVHGITQRDDVLVLIWLGFPVLMLTTAFFLGAFASWSPFFLPIPLFAVVVSALAYKSAG